MGHLDCPWNSPKPLIRGPSKWAHLEMGLRLLQSQSNQGKVESTTFLEIFSQCSSPRLLLQAFGWPEEQSTRTLTHGTCQLPYGQPLLILQRSGGGACSLAMFTSPLGVTWSLWQQLSDHSQCSSKLFYRARINVFICFLYTMYSFENLYYVTIQLPFSKLKNFKCSSPDRTQILHFDCPFLHFSSNGWNFTWLTSLQLGMGE